MKRFEIKQKFWSLAGKFDIKDDDGQLAYQVQGSFLRWPKEFTISDSQGRLVSHIKHHFRLLFPRFTVTFADGRQIIIQQKWSFLKARYDISDFGLKVAGDIWNMNFRLLDQGREVANIHQQWLKIPSTYHLEIADDQLTDLVISLVIAIDYVKSLESRNSSASS